MQQKQGNKKAARLCFIISLLILSVLPLSSSQEFSQLTENPLILLGGIFIIIFFVSYSILLKTPLGDNRLVCILISLSLAGIATFYLSQTQVAIISTVIALLAIGIFLIILFIFGRFAYASFGIGGVIFAIGLFLVMLRWIPHSPEIPGWVYALAQIGFFIGIGVCILGIILGLVRGRR